MSIMSRLFVPFQVLVVKVVLGRCVQDDNKIRRKLGDGLGLGGSDQVTLTEPRITREQFPDFDSVYRVKVRAAFLGTNVSSKTALFALAASSEFHPRHGVQFDAPFETCESVFSQRFSENVLSLSVWRPCNKCTIPVQFWPRNK